MTDERENSDRQHGGRWKPGTSGNPAGKPRGAKNKATRAVEAMLDGEAEALTRTAIDAALGGDVTALRLCLERITPPRKDSPISIDLPKIEKASDVVGAQAAITEAVAAGDLTPSEAASLSQLVERVGSAIELRDLEARVEALESSRGGHDPQSRTQHG